MIRYTFKDKNKYEKLNEDLIDVKKALNFFYLFKALLFRTKRLYLFIKLENSIYVYLNHLSNFQNIFLVRDS